MQLSYTAGAKQLLHEVAAACKTQDGYYQLAGPTGLLSFSQLVEIQERARYISAQLYENHKLFGSPAQLEAYLGKSIARLPEADARQHMFERVLVGELIEACFQTLLTQAGITCRPSIEDDDPKRNFYDHIISAHGHTYLADSKLIAFQVNGNISWSDWRKIRTVHHHCNPEMPQNDRLALILVAKCHVNLNIFAPVAVIRAEPFYKYTVDSPMAKRRGLSAPLYMHLKDKSSRFDDHVLLSSPIFGVTGSGAPNQLCDELLYLYRSAPEQFTKLIDDESALND